MLLSTQCLYVGICSLTLSSSLSALVNTNAHNLSDSAFCNNFHRLGVPQQALGGIPLAFVELS